MARLASVTFENPWFFENPCSKNVGLFKMWHANALDSWWSIFGNDHFLHSLWPAWSTFATNLLATPGSSLVASYLQGVFNWNLDIFINECKVCSKFLGDVLFARFCKLGGFWPNLNIPISRWKVCSMFLGGSSLKGICEVHILNCLVMG